MIFLQLNPFSKPVAIFEMLILLVLAIIIGWLIAWLITNKQILFLGQSIEKKNSELEDCTSQKLELIQHGRSYSGISVTGPQLKTRVITVPANKVDDLKTIEGIGPKIQELINDAGIYSFEQLSKTSPLKLLDILKQAGPAFQMHDPSSWPMQADLAFRGKWAELQILKNELIAGR